MDGSLLNGSFDLGHVASSHAASYRDAAPFSHIVLDGLFDDDCLRRIATDFPGADSTRWKRFDDANQVKLALADEEQMPASIRDLIHRLNAAPFLRFLETLTGIPNLIPDPHLAGGGLHMILPGGKLGVHADFNKHPTWNLDRRLNLLLYLNEDWKEEFGGHLELWNESRTGCAKRILPVFNRMVVFSTTDFAYHGHPHPLACPPGRSRRSIALYYYSNGRPADERSLMHTTLFHPVMASRLRKAVSMLVPPVVPLLMGRLARRRR